MDNFLVTLDILKYGIIVLLLLGLTFSILSPFVVLSEQSLIADGLSHVSFTALAIGMFFMNDPFYIAIPIVVLASMLIKFIAHYTKIHADASIGIVSSVAFAIGLIIIKYSNSTIDLESLISGNLWFRNLGDVWIALGVFLIALIFIILNYRALIALTFDYDFARFKGVKVGLLSYLFAAIVGVFIVVGVRSIGVLLISSLLIFPVTTANMFSKKFKDLFIYGTLITVGVIILGIFSAHVFNVPTGSMIVLIYFLVFISIYTIKSILRKDT